MELVNYEITIMHSSKHCYISKNERTFRILIKLHQCEVRGDLDTYVHKSLYR